MATNMNENVNTNEVVCANCGQVILIENAILTADGDYVCQDCFDDDYVECAECGEIIRKDDAIRTADGDYICESCYDDNYFTCEDCGAVIRMDDAVPVNHGDFYVCQDCADRNYTRCDDCGEYFTDGHIWAEDDCGTAICYDCCDSYVVCADCGRIISSDDAEWCERDGEYYCDDCIDDHRGHLHEYGYKPFPEFHHSRREDLDDMPLYFGVELEVDGGDDQDNLCDDLNDLGLPIYLKEDSSLDRDGVEIVTHPCTLAYHLGDLGWHEIVSTCRDHDYVSHDSGNCGLHVHVGREEMGETEEQREQVAMNLVLLAWHMDAELIRFSRRTSEQLRQWAKFPNLDDFSHNQEDLFYYAKKLATRTWDHCDRYRAVNVQNRATIEFRFFRGTLKETTLLASIQLVNNLTKYAMHHTPEECATCSFDDIVAVEEFEELREYSISRGILKPVQ